MHRNFSKLAPYSPLNHTAMKRTYLLLLLLASVALHAQVVLEPTLSAAFKKAQEQNKPVFIEYYNSDCSVCKRLGGLLREDAAVIAQYNSNFINYAMNTYDELSAEESALLANANLHFESVPVLLYFDKNKNFLHHSNGDINAAVVIAESQKAVLPEYNSSGLKAKYDTGDRSVRTLYAYSNLLLIQKNDPLLKTVTQQLFESFNKAELPTKKSYLILKQVVNSTDNGFFQYWVNNVEGLKGFETGAKADTELGYLQTILLRELSQPDIKKWDRAKKSKYKDYILKLKITDNPDVFFEDI